MNMFNFKYLLTFILFVGLSLQAETKTEYEKALSNDLILFQTLYAPSLQKLNQFNEFTHSNRDFIVGFISSKDIYELDLKTLMYLDYKSYIMTKYKSSDDLLFLINQ